MSSGSLKTVMILGSVRHGRMVERVAKFVTKSVKAHTSSLTLETLDPLVLDSTCELNRQPLHYLSGSDEGGWMRETNEVVKKANAFLVLCTEYNGNMPPALLNILNSLPPPSFRHKPVGIVTYTQGTTGAMRALNVARSFMSELGMLVVPGYVAIPMVHENIDGEGDCKNDLVKDNMSKLVRNLEWYARAIVNHHQNGNRFVEY